MARLGISSGAIPRLEPRLPSRRRIAERSRLRRPTCSQNTLTQMDWVKRYLPSEEVDLEFDHDMEQPRPKRRRKNVATPRRQAAQLQESELSAPVPVPTTDRDLSTSVDNHAIKEEEPATHEAAQEDRAASPLPSTSGYHSKAVPLKADPSPLGETSVNVQDHPTHHGRRGKLAKGHPPLEIEETYPLHYGGSQSPRHDPTSLRPGPESPHQASLGRGNYNPTKGTSISSTATSYWKEESSSRSRVLGTPKQELINTQPATPRYQGRLEIQDSEEDSSEDDSIVAVKNEAASDIRALPESSRASGEVAHETDGTPDHPTSAYGSGVKTEPALQSAGTSEDRSGAYNHREVHQHRHISVPSGSPEDVQPTHEETSSSPDATSPDQQLQRETLQSQHRLNSEIDDSSSSASNSQAQAQAQDPDEYHHDDGNEDEHEHEDYEDLHLDSLTASQLLPESLMRDFLPMPPSLTQETDKTDETDSS